MRNVVHYCITYRDIIPKYTTVLPIDILSYRECSIKGTEKLIFIDAAMHPEIDKRTLNSQIISHIFMLDSHKFQQKS